MDYEAHYRENYEKPAQEAIARLQASGTVQPEATIMTVDEYVQKAKAYRRTQLKALVWGSALDVFQTVVKWTVTAAVVTPVVRSLW